MLKMAEQSWQVLIDQKNKSKEGKGDAAQYKMLFKNLKQYEKNVYRCAGVNRAACLLLFIPMKGRKYLLQNRFPKIKKRFFYDYFPVSELLPCLC